MSDEHEVGSVGEEAMKLFGALADLARQQAGDAASGLGGLAGQAAAMAHEVDEHLATDADECRYCPVCRAVHLVRETSPEVKAHLSSAAASLLQAAAGLLETMPGAASGSGTGPGSGSGEGAPRGSAVERIDLDDTDDTTDDDTGGDTPAAAVDTDADPDVGREPGTRPGPEPDGGA